jgi:AAA+ superfamily predicted ATPase
MDASTESVAAAAWVEANQACLGAEMERLRLLFKRRVLWLRQGWRQDPLASQRGLVISEAQADRLLDSTGDAERDFLQQDAQARTLAQALEKAEAGLAARRAALAASGAIPALDALARSFGLDAFGRDALLLCFAVDEDADFATLCAYVQDDANARHATPQLLLGVLCQPGPQREAARMALLQSAPLRRFALLRTDDALAPRHAGPLAIDERIADYVRGVNRIDDRMAQMVRPLPAAPLTQAQRDLVERLLRRAESAAGEWTPLQLTGPAGAGKKAVAAAFCAKVGLQLYGIDLARLLQEAGPDAALHLVEREAVLSDMALYVDTAELDPADRPSCAAAQDWIERYGGVLFIGGRERWPARRQTLHIAVPKPDAAGQAELWSGALQPLAHALDGQIEAIVQQFDLGPDAIGQAVNSAATLANERPGDVVLTPADLWQACREQVGGQIRGLAERLTPCYGWDDIVLPDDLARQLHELADQVGARAQVYESWGFGKRLPRGRGISALFSGPSGTGKTMAAEILANHLQLDLYRTDLAGVVSKYIGETEKNLRKVFDAAEQSGAILFFDEADALFGKRSEVRDSHDRYANIEVNYLLQRMEDYRGLAILCTNRRAALDRAFLRRLRFLVEFPFPDAEQRRQIWQKVFPPEAPRTQLDLATLARLEISGGNIRNIALNAAFLAAGGGAGIGMEHVLHAARREYAKIDKLITESEFGAHLRLMKP